MVFSEKYRIISTDFGNSPGYLGIPDRAGSVGNYPTENPKQKIFKNNQNVTIGLGMEFRGRRFK